ncbi:MAG: S-layer homology domain-containing protein [Clostridiales bacterium]|nr:MAG: S-layer homology domain-containing protein [Clostridiales bacterium]
MYQAPGEIITHIDNYKSVIPFSTDTYDASDKSETAVYIANLKRNYTLMQTLKDDIDSAYGAQTNGGGNGGSSSSSGSRGGSSSGFFSRQVQIPHSPSKKGSFNDLPSTHWAYEVIEGLKAKGIVSGDEKGNFNPENSITREEFAKILVCAFGLYDENAECSFADASGHWSYKYVASLYKNGNYKRH